MWTLEELQLLCHQRLAAEVDSQDFLLCDTCGSKDPRLPSLLI